MMMTLTRRRSLLLAACAAAAAPGAAFATAAGGSGAPAASHAWLAQSRRIGQGTLRMLGLHIYDASLFALTDFDAEAFAAHSLVLEIHYRRAFTGEAIADYSLKQMRRSAAPDDAAAERWLQFMRRAFPDVKPGDRLTGQWLPGSSLSRFAANDAAAHELQDARFGPHFFGIWLARETPRPELREQLLGRKAPS